MAEITASPDDLGAVAGHTGRDAEDLGGLAPSLRAAGSSATSGVGTSHAGLAAAVSDLARVEAAVLLALADAAQILSEGFAGAAEDYRDVEIHNAAMLRRTVAA